MRSFYHRLAVLAIVAGLPGCAPLSESSQAFSALFDSPAAQPPAKLIEPCPPLADIPDTMSAGDVEREIADLIMLYLSCQAKHTGLSGFIRDRDKVVTGK